MKTILYIISLVTKVAHRKGMKNFSFDDLYDGKETFAKKSRYLIADLYIMMKYIFS
jgi:hypothetical protein